MQQIHSDKVGSLMSN